MIYEVKDKNLRKVETVWEIKELELEDYIESLIEYDETNNKIYGVLTEVFGEDLFYINKEVRTNSKKRADLLFLDKNGDATIVELKKDEGKLGVETQALQYLADFSHYQGKAFVDRFCNHIDEELIKDFLYDDIDIEQLNSNSRIILMARYFDETLFSMGKWFADNNISFRCVSYNPIKINESKLINFSVVFDQLSKHTKYKIEFKDNSRKPSDFWHIIGEFDPKWWEYLIKKNQISASFDNQPGDKGETILKKYVKGDRIFAYASGHGLIGYGVIDKDVEKKGVYKLIEKKSDDDKRNGLHRHRLSCKWEYVIKDIKNAISPSKLKKYHIHHPFQTSSKIKKGEINKMLDDFKNNPDVVKL